MGPTFNGLKGLVYALGITPLFVENKYYENSVSPGYVNGILSANNFISLINISSVVFFAPILVGIVLKILSATKYK